MFYPAVIAFAFGHFPERLLSEGFMRLSAAFPCVHIALQHSNIANEWPVGALSGGIALHLNVLAVRRERLGGYGQAIRAPMRLIDASVAPTARA
ncbi:hypothetical protein [Azospirillum sp. TSA6c]|uniref:hypothetical protein n=1 Tax=unclassified Azospirillum TaxID=2630922 RepID=UPI0011B6A89C|nr:hypothetical protein [Azospirillum sp. TSA6c]